MSMQAVDIDRVHRVRGLVRKPGNPRAITSEEKIDRASRAAELRHFVAVNPCVDIDAIHRNRK